MADLSRRPRSLSVPRPDGSDRRGVAVRHARRPSGRDVARLRFFDPQSAGVRLGRIETPPPRLTTTPTAGPCRRLANCPAVSSHSNGSTTHRSSKNIISARKRVPRVRRSCPVDPATSRFTQGLATTNSVEATIPSRRFGTGSRGTSSGSAPRTNSTSRCDEAAAFGIGNERRPVANRGRIVRSLTAPADWCRCPAGLIHSTG